MGLKYPKIGAEGVVFREQFINNQYVTDNGVVLTNVPVVDNGMTLNGTSQYATPADEYKYSFGDGITDSPFSIEFFGMMTDATSFTIASKGVNNVDAEWLFYVATTDKVYIQCHDESVADCRIGRAYNTAITSYEGQMIHLVATYDGSSTEAGLKIYLNGVQVDDVSVGANQGSYVAMEKQEHDVWIGRYSASYANGLFRGVSIYDKELTEGEVSDRFSQLTFKEPTPENSEIWLDLKTRYYDPGVTKDVTPNLGLINSDQFLWGDGTTPATFPELLEGNGASFTGTEYIKINAYTPLGLNDVSEVISVGALVKVDELGTNLTVIENDLNWLVTILADGTVGLQFTDSANDYHKYNFSDGVLPVGQWAHICCTYDGSDTAAGDKVYINGVLQGSSLVSWDAGLTNSSNAAAIGIRATTFASTPMIGDIKYPFVTMNELTETQVKWLSDQAFRKINL